jgi:hypothetical protein
MLSNSSKWMLACNQKGPFSPILLFRWAYFSSKASWEVWELWLFNVGFQTSNFSKTNGFQVPFTLAKSSNIYSSIGLGPCFVSSFPYVFLRLFIPPMVSVSSCPRGVSSSQLAEAEHRPSSSLNSLMQYWGLWEASLRLKTHSASVKVKALAVWFFHPLHLWGWGLATP